MSNLPIVRLVRDHSKDCPSRKAASREWNPNFRDFWLNTYKPKPHESRSKTGRQRGGHYRWIEFTCAWREGCRASLLVRVDTIEELVNEVLSGRRKP